MKTLYVIMPSLFQVSGFRFQILALAGGKDYFINVSYRFLPILFNSLNKIVRLFADSLNNLYLCAQIDKTNKEWTSRF